MLVVFFCVRERGGWLRNEGMFRPFLVVAQSQKFAEAEGMQFHVILILIHMNWGSPSSNLIYSSSLLEHPPCKWMNFGGKWEISVAMLVYGRTNVKSICKERW